MAFFLNPVPSLLRGAGDTLEKTFPALGGVPLALVMPQRCASSTREVYEEYDRAPIAPKSPDALCEAMAVGDMSGVAVPLLVALFLQIAVNYANDYSDGIRGTDAGRDTDESKSGKPQRLTASGLVPAKHVLFAAMICAAIACICGIAAIVISQAWWLFAVGVASLLAGWFYTGGKHPYGYVGLGEVGVFLFFGLAAVLGTEYALCGTVDVGGLLGAVAAGLFSCLIMMVNNIRDIDEDREHGKCTLAVRLGESGARTLLIVCCVAAWAIALLMCATLWWPWGAVLLISGVGIPVRMVSSVNKRQFRPALPAASFQTLLFAVVLAVSVTL